MKEFMVKSCKRQELIDISHELNQIIEQNQVKEGVLHCYVPHATAAIIINENYDPNICLDFLDALNKSFPDSAGYRHDRIDGNAGAHIKAAILGPGEMIPISQGKLELGTWQSVMVCDLDGPKERRVIVKIIGT